MRIRRKSIQVSISKFPPGILLGCPSQVREKICKWRFSELQDFPLNTCSVIFSLNYHVYMLSSQYIKKSENTNWTDSVPWRLMKVTWSTADSIRFKMFSQPVVQGALDVFRKEKTLDKWLKHLKKKKHAFIWSTIHISESTLNS